ncbi:MAG: uroporphyrinogen-III synthase [Rickettsiales bacterium]|nr:uroporphyrinogen-III synthase [Rickettsiales bacterium]
MPNYLILRPEESAKKTTELLQTKGFNVIIEPIYFVEKLTPIVADKSPQSLIITSSNACDAIINSGLALDVKIFAVGLQSAEKLLACGYKNIFHPTKSSAEDLKNLIIKNLDPKNGKILYFCGDSITLNFKLELEPIGFMVDKILSYKIKWHTNFSAEFLQKISRQKIDFVLIYSQNSARKFYQLLKNNNLLEYFADSKLLCLSDKIVATSKELGFRNVEYFAF